MLAVPDAGLGMEPVLGGEGVVGRPRIPRIPLVTKPMQALKPEVRAGTWKCKFKFPKSKIGRNRRSAISRPNRIPRMEYAI